MPRVSVIIPVYNNEKYVEKCIRSVMNQTYRDLEIIVIDDGSDDKSPEILERLAKEDSRIQLTHQENQGVAAARNRGLELASGKYLTFIDGDDYVSSEYIAHLYDCAEEKCAELVICGLNYVNENGELLRTLIPDAYQRFEREEWTFRISAVCSHFYERTLWEKYGVRFYIGERGEDMPISLFFSATCSRIDVLPEAGYYYVQHETSAMHHFRGLRTYRLPYRALEDTIQKVQDIGVVNSPEFYELFVLRILATCFFDLGRGSSRTSMNELCDYIERILNSYFPRYYRNKKAGLCADVRVPFSQKAAVWLLVLLVRTRLLHAVSRFLIA